MSDPIAPPSRRSLLSRRAVLKGAAAGAAVGPFVAGPLVAGRRAAVAQDGTVRPDALTGREAVDAAATGGPGAGPHPGVIVRQWEPRNLEYPLPSLSGPLTPTNQFYVRSHFDVPPADPKTWTLTVGGMPGEPGGGLGDVRISPRTFTLAELEVLGTEEKTVTMECAGNGRIFLVPKPSGLLWETGGVGTAVWKGTPLRKVLEACGYPTAEARQDSDRNHVMLQGADHGKLSAYPAPLHYNRGLPIAKALDDVLLATHMNGEPLPPHHGYPLRAIVPGWYGAASVKWLDRVTVTNEPDNGFFSTFDYAIFKRTPAGEQLVPLTGMQVKSSLARPARGERVKAGEAYVCRGAAWAGERAIAKVEFSSDGGETWAEAKLVDEPQPLVWTRWRFDWTPPQAGSYTLMSRATDSAGETQPAEHDPLRRAYMVNFTVPVGVEAVG
ncbi:sulfite oxidase [Alienimonas californiensis]|uniref:TMAO/DMSO reductase n=1 Tax=Alienimonas californiensis TaxID=2527989 RepID=A0A517PAC3_9PLAN|nr:sulfite oxidase [Alienimonas californiensis]QDT16328.1 TMAO/DMSO reductase [Alienimonas californiensis]